MYTDNHAQKLYNEAQSYRANALKSNRITRKLLLYAASRLEKAAQTYQEAVQINNEARIIEEENKQKLKLLKKEDFKKLKENANNLPEGLQKLVSDMFKQLDT